MDNCFVFKHLIPLVPLKQLTQFFGLFFLCKNYSSIKLIYDIFHWIPIWQSNCYLIWVQLGKEKSVKTKIHSERLYDEYFGHRSPGKNSLI